MVTPGARSVRHVFMIACSLEGANFGLGEHGAGLLSAGEVRCSYIRRSTDLFCLDRRFSFFSAKRLRPPSVFMRGLGSFSVCGSRYKGWEGGGRMVISDQLGGGGQSAHGRSACTCCDGWGNASFCAMQDMERSKQLLFSKVYPAGPCLWVFFVSM